MELTDNKTGKNGRMRKKKSSLDTMIYGKVPPQAVEIERAVLGAMLIDKNAIDSVIDLLTPTVFYNNGHGLIFRAMLNLYSASQPIDILTVTEQIKKEENLETVGGPYYITKLTNDVVSAANIEAHAKILFQQFIKREIIRIGGEMAGDGFEDSTDCFQILDDIEEQLFKLTSSVSNKSQKPFNYVCIEVFKEITHAREQKSKISGVTSGFTSIDRITNGWQNTDLIIIAARPSVGKTALALNFARNAALNPEKRIPVGMFSLEMSASQLIRRLLSAEAEVSFEHIKRADLEDQEMKQLYEKGLRGLAEMPLFIDDTPALNIFELRAKARRMKQKHNIGLLIIDYLQLMSGPKNTRDMNREQQVADISRNLKNLARELGIPIIALSQLSRAVETRGGSKMPQLSDLRESGSIEQDADAVLFIYRPEYYGIMRDEAGESNFGETHIRFAKHRNGVLDTVKLKARLNVQKFDEYDSNPFISGSKMNDHGLSGPVNVGDAVKEDLPF